MSGDLLAGRPVGKIYSANLGREITVYAKEGETDEEALRRVQKRHKVTSVQEKGNVEESSKGSKNPEQIPDKDLESALPHIEPGMLEDDDD